MAGMKLTKSPLAPENTPKLPDIAGVKFAVGCNGFYGDRDDVFVAYFDEEASAAGVFTRSSTCSADVDWCREALRLSEGKARALVVNAGNSNAFTGAAGIAKNEATIAAVSKLGNVERENVFIAATGVIGEPLEPKFIADKVHEIWPSLGEASLNDAGVAFMTTDTFPKASAGEAAIDGEAINIAGVAKGSGMIMPNMATMLAYVFTDANLSPQVCQSLLSRYTNETFNCITVDGDTSTSDTVMLFATGKSGSLIDDVNDPRLEEFAAELHKVMLDLSVQIVRDGEGASKLIAITVSGAKTDNSAKIIATSIANSPLVKTALAASDANWGRIVMAVGKTDQPVNKDKLSISFGDVEVASGGMRAANYSEDAASEICQSSEISIKVDVGVGEGIAQVWTCDLTHGYVDINGAYRT
ncbi:bifunctional glutamate N-acetyltransferase/amino-acid acetyltransferase ArgJ [Hirschia maritima]|uniref:bifunctional glutamate N-acetyltransferase/amino-acid acetyltransferase ArgJ n=1 Tax=Hirschia maritima TaxID=1121961 RepID=UPI000372277B|nr:bifunctional glutamate N-acetyltransferase/amino-acid acetyltransferase ArgJ [Hirschia maritima]